MNKVNREQLLSLAYDCGCEAKANAKTNIPTKVDRDEMLGLMGLNDWSEVPIPTRKEIYDTFSRGWHKEAGGT